MTKIQEIEKAIAQLPPRKFFMLKSWIYKLEAARWEKEIKEGIKIGKLDAMAVKSLFNVLAGKCKTL